MSTEACKPQGEGADAPNVVLLSGSTNTLPPMPWQSLARLPVPDLKAIFAYLKAQAPVYNQVPAYQPPAAP